MLAMSEDFESVDDSIKEDAEDHQKDNDLKVKVQMSDNTTNESII